MKHGEMIRIESNRQAVQNAASFEELTGPHYEGWMELSISCIPQRSTVGWVVKVWGGCFYLKNMGHGRVGDDKSHLEGDILRLGVVEKGVLFFVCFVLQF